MTNLDNLINTIYSSFEDNKPPYKFKILKSFDAWNYDPEKYFSLKSWKDILNYNWAEESNDISDVPIFMTVDSFCNFLPAYMIITLSIISNRTKLKFHWNNTSQIERALLPRSQQEISYFKNIFSKKQRNIIARFLFEIMVNSLKDQIFIGEKTDSQVALENFWFIYLKDEDLSLFSDLIELNRRPRIEYLSDDSIKNHIDIIKIYSDHIKENDSNNQECLYEFLSSLIALIQNNNTITDDILISMSRGNELSISVKSLIKSFLFNYGILERSQP